MKAIHLNYSHRASVKLNKHKGAGGLFQYLQGVAHFYLQIMDMLFILKYWSHYVKSMLLVIMFKK
jgi:hypothetical protein